MLPLLEMEKRISAEVGHSLPLHLNPRQLATGININWIVGRFRKLHLNASQSILTHRKIGRVLPRRYCRKLDPPPTFRRRVRGLNLVQKKFRRDPLHGDEE